MIFIKAEAVVIFSESRTESQRRESVVQLKGKTVWIWKPYENHMMIKKDGPRHAQTYEKCWKPSAWAKIALQTMAEEGLINYMNRRISKHL